MARNCYECLFILDANRYARDPGAVTATIPDMVQKEGGELLANRLWNEQKLAYPINGQRKGTYWLTYFKMESERLSAFNRSCQLNDNVLRHLVLKVEPRLVDALVSHALGEKKEEPPKEEAKKEGAKKEETKKEETKKEDAPAASQQPADAAPKAD